MYEKYILFGTTLSVICIVCSIFYILHICEKNEYIPTNSPIRRNRRENINLPDPEILELNGDL
jgi:hypothetical protein